MKLIRCVLGGICVLVGGGGAAKPAELPQAPASEQPPAATRWQTYTRFPEFGVNVTEDVDVRAIHEPEQEFRYAAFSRPDPFVPPAVGSRRRPPRALEIAVESPLQEFALADLTLVGVWELNSGDQKALVTTPRGVALVARPGDAIGRSGGTVAAIEADAVLVRAFHLTPDGTREYRDVRLKLGQPGVHPADTKPERIVLEPGEPPDDVVVPEQPASPLTKVEDNP